MAEKKQHTIVSASTGKTVKRDGSQPNGNATGLRVGAAVLWVVAIVCEIAALGVICETIIIPFLSKIPPLYQGIGLLVLDFILVVLGAQLWKKANHIKPMSKKNAFLFWLWNNMGVIVCAIAFIPFIIVLLANKELDKKTKTVGVAAAAIMLLISGLASYDFNPVSAEDYAAAGLGGVYWTKYGTVFHSHEDCSSLSRTDELTTGSIQEAQDAGKQRMCKICEKRDNIIKQLPAQKEADEEEPAA